MVRVELEISDAERERFARQAKRQGMTLDAWLVKIARQHVAEPDATNGEPQPGETAFDHTAPSVLEMFDEIHRAMPKGALDALPADLSANLKRYLYGWPKETEGE